MEWQEEFSVGDRELDADHRIIFSLINDYQFVEASESDRKHAEFIIGELEAYIRHHFAREEKHLKRIAYPDLDHHRHKHAEMLTTLASLKQRHEDREVNVASEISRFLNEWWEKHILIEDMAYRTFADS